MNTHQPTSEARNPNPNAYVAWMALAAALAPVSVIGALVLLAVLVRPELITKPGTGSRIEATPVVPQALSGTSTAAGTPDPTASDAVLENQPPEFRKRTPPCRTPESPSRPATGYPDTPSAAASGTRVAGTATVELPTDSLREVWCAPKGQMYETGDIVYYDRQRGHFMAVLIGDLMANMATGKQLFLVVDTTPDTFAITRLQSDTEPDASSESDGWISTTQEENTPNANKPGLAAAF